MAATASQDRQDRDELVATSSAALREQALQRVKKRRDFYGHLLVYALVNAALWAIWGVSAADSHGGEFPWPMFITLFWGVGLVMNAWDVFFRRPITEEEVQREMQHLRPQH